ncbi:MAG: PucR family transcriptional regulator [Dorea longicatena]
MHCFDDLTLEILLGSLNEVTTAEFIAKTLSCLDETDCSLLRSYFDHEQSLSRTSEYLYLHKNTLQYKLDRIHKICGLNPRSFQRRSYSLSCSSSERNVDRTASFFTQYMSLETYIAFIFPLFFILRTIYFFFSYVILHIKKSILNFYFYVPKKCISGGLFT